MSWVIPTAIPFIALLSYGALLFITFRQGFQKRVHRLFTIYLTAMLVWSFGALLMYLDSPSAILWNRVMLSGLVAMPLTVFAFVRGFLRLERSPWPLYLGSVALLALWGLNACGCLTSDVHFTADGLLRYEFGPAFPIFAANSALFLGLAAFYLIRGYRQTKDPIEQNRLRYAFFGISAIALGSSTNLIPALGAYPIDIAGNIINALLLAYAIFRYQLLDISVVVRRGVLYSIPTIIISAGYLFTVFLAINLFHNVAGYEILFLSFIVAAVIAVASQPLRDKLQDGVDKLFFREKHDSSLMLQKLSQTATTVLDLDRLTDMILDELAATMHPTKSAFLLPGSEGGRFMVVNQRGLDQASMSLGQDHPLVQWLASHKTTLTWKEADVLPQFRALWTEEREALAKIEAELFVPLLSRAGLIGILILGAKRAELPYSLDEQRTLSTLANQMAIAIENAHLYEAAQQELSERQRAEGELRKSEQRYRSLVETAADVIFTISVDGRLTSLNPVFTTITGWSRAEWLDKPFAPIVHPDDLPVAVELFQRVLQGETPLFFELRLLSKSGEHLVGQFAVTPQIQDGKVVGVLGIARDVTERKRLEQRIAERTRELATLYDVTAVASESLDLQVTLRRSLARVLEALRCPAGAIQLLDKTEQVVRLAVHQGISPQLAAQLDAVPVDSGLLGWMLEHGEPVLITDVASDPRAPRAVSTSGFQVYVCAPMRCRGQVLGVFSIFGGAEQQIHLEDVALLASIADHAGVAVENAQLHRQAEQAAALQERERLARELHDSVTQSLFSLTLFTEAAREMARTGELASIDQHLAEVDTIARQSLKDMRLLLYELRPSALQEEGLVGALRRRLEAVEKRLGIEARVVTDTLRQLPAPVEEGLYHIAQEALNNALKHAEATAVSVYIRTEGEHIILEVSDNGLGFTPDEVSDQGGMGMKSMRQRAEKLGGICTVLAQPGQGTRVQVNLPLAN